MKSKVYFIPIKDANAIEQINGQLLRLIKESRVFDFIAKGEKVATKVHFGEEGNTGYVRPQHLKIVTDEIKNRGAVTFLSDTNTLYRGKRLNSSDHIKLAHAHGFTEEVTGACVVIPDDTKKEDMVSVEISQKNIKSANVARYFIEADAIVAVSHFKGHILTGFGGALKNIGMGCASRQGKLAQHCDAAPVVYVDNCTGCGECSIACPAGAIRIENKKAILDKEKCIGCATCVGVCPSMAMFIDFKAGDKVQEKMAEYSLAVLKNKKQKAGFINFALRINKECDCWGAENPRIAPDVGIFASNDPVAIDKAGFDRVNKACGKDIFKETHPEPNGQKQLEYAQSLGLGNIDYELIEL